MKITMKKAIGLIMAVVMAATFAACGSEVEKADSSVGDPETKSMFVVVEDAGTWMVVYHRDTKVMYSVSDSSYNYGNMTLLVNADGTPMIYSGDK